MPDLAGLTADIVSAYVAQNKLSTSDLAGLILNVHTTLANIDQPGPPVAQSAAKKPTAAQIRKSITPDALISFLDGRRYKTLKRHIATNGLTVDQYKATFGLPHDYPTTAPGYSAARSAMAHAIGLGKKLRRPVEAQVEAEPETLDLPVELDPPAEVSARKKLHLPFGE